LEEAIMEKTEQKTAADSCPDCHALVADLEAHKRWHQRLVHDIAMAVDKDIQRKASTTSS
jgi:hypothetical protein